MSPSIPRNHLGSQTAGRRPLIWRKAPWIRRIKPAPRHDLTVINAAHALSPDTRSMSSALILAEQKVPRYTSYPTAPHFTAAVGPDTYAEWLAALPETATLSLYIHVPYCTQLCLYCGCHTKMVRRPEPLQAYARRLAGEIALLARTLEGRRVLHIHWGGGTPSILGPATLIELSAKIAERFDLTQIREHAIELDPRRIDPALAQALAQIGFNRVSLGIQDFAPQVQEAIGRVQPFETVTRAVRMLREAGIPSMNFDLMYGLPRQTVHDVQESAWTAATLQARRIALFGYAHVPWLKPHQRLIDAAALPGAAERLDQAEAARTMLLALGYQAVGFDHFALPEDDLALAARTGRLHRNFQGYTTDGADALIGLGASAIGRLPQGYVQNAPVIGTYSAAIDAGRHATAKGVALSEEDRVRGRIIERILCDLEIDLETVAGEARRLGLGGFEPELAALEPLERQGIVERQSRRIRVTERGRAFVRLVAATFDSYLRDSEARHSMAV
jgi:oxygen-independent coproporphyrinogen-3 oxidase